MHLNLNPHFPHVCPKSGCAVCAWEDRRRQVDTTWREGAKINTAFVYEKACMDEAKVG